MSTQLSPESFNLVHVSKAPYSGGIACGGGGCPAVYATPHGTFVVIGRKLSAAEKTGLPMDGIEDALEIPGELLAAVVPKLFQ